MLSWIVIGIIWKWIYNPNIGFLDSLLNLLGIQTSGAGWLSDPKIALYCVFAAALWQGCRPADAVFPRRPAGYPAGTV